MGAGIGNRVSNIEYAVHRLPHRSELVKNHMQSAASLRYAKQGRPYSDWSLLCDDDIFHVRNKAYRIIHETVESLRSPQKLSESNKLKLHKRLADQVVRFANFVNEYRRNECIPDEIDPVIRLYDEIIGDPRYPHASQSPRDLFDPRFKQAQDDLQFGIREAYPLILKRLTDVRENTNHAGSKMVELIARERSLLDALAYIENNKEMLNLHLDDLPVLPHSQRASHNL